MISDPRSDPVVTEFANELRRRLGDSLREIRLFGSRARGQARDDSDYDMLVIVDRKTGDIRHRIVDLEVEILDRYGAVVASVVRTEQDWKERQGLPLARNIAREGVAL